MQLQKISIVFVASLLGNLLLPVLLFAAGQQVGGEVTLTDSHNSLSLATAILKTLGALIAVIGLMLLTMFWIKKSGMVRTGPSKDGLISILDTQMLAPKKQVSVLRVAGTYLVVGISEQQISLLATLAANDQLIEASQPRQTRPLIAPSFASLLDKAGQALSAIKDKKEGPAHEE